MSSQSGMSFFRRLCSRWSEHIRVEQVLAAPVCYIAVLAARKKLTCRLLVLLVAREKEKCESFVVTTYERQVRSTIVQQRPLLISHQVARGYSLIRPRALAYCKHLVIGSKRCQVPALRSLHFVILLGRSVRFALQTLRVGVIAMEIK